MEVTTTLSKLCSLLKISIFVGLLAFSLSARAEYYVVYSAPCGYCTHKHKVSSHHKYHKIKKHVVKHHKRSTCSVYTYYSWYPVDTCAYANRCERSTCGGCGERRQSYRDTGYAYDYYDNDYGNYDPDMSTGDDNAMTYPGMDIDN